MSDAADDRHWRQHLGCTVVEAAKKKQMIIVSDREIRLARVWTIPRSGGAEEAQFTEDGKPVDTQNDYCRHETSKRPQKDRVYYCNWTTLGGNMEGYVHAAQSCRRRLHYSTRWD